MSFFRLFLNLVTDLLPRPVTLLSVVNNLLTTRLDLDAQRLWMAIAHQVLEVYTAKIDVS
jgi:neurofibromin 1